MKECVNCKYHCGGGSDVWCGHDPKGRETYMPSKDTDCLYYEPLNVNKKRELASLPTDRKTRQIACLEEKCEYLLDMIKFGCTEETYERTKRVLQLIEEHHMR